MDSFFFCVFFFFFFWGGGGGGGGFGPCRVIQYLLSFLVLQSSH